MVNARKRYCNKAKLGAYYRVVSRGMLVMNRSIGLALVAAAASLVASQADASPTFQLMIQSGAVTAQYTASGDSLDVSGIFPNFKVNSLHADYALGPVITNFSGSVTHTSKSTSPIKLTLTLADLTNSGTSAIYTDDFDGTFASSNPGNIAKLNVYTGKTAFKTTDLLFESGKVRPTDNASPPCAGPNGSTFSCSFYDPSVLPAWSTYSITQVVTLYFAASTNGGTATFSNHLADPIPEPGALGLMLSGLLVASGFAFRPKRAA